MQIAAFKDRPTLARALSKALKSPIAWAEAGHYASGEVKVEGPGEVASRVVVAADVEEEAESLMRILFLAAALRSSGARHVTLVAPWIAYGRQDRVTKAGESPAGIVVAKTLSQAFDRIVTLDAHSPAFIHAFGNRLVNVMPVLGKMTGVDVIVAPDWGAAQRAERLAWAWKVPCVVLEKRHVRQGVVTKMAKKDQVKVKDRKALVVDDMADSGGTLKAAAKVLRQAGARNIRIFVTHALNPAKLRRGLWDTSVYWAYDHAKKQLNKTFLKAIAGKIS